MLARGGLLAWLLHPLRSIVGNRRFVTSFKTLTSALILQSAIEVVVRVYCTTPIN